ncbi:hypothetical protein B0T16DRAFT_316060 [Cercophora newfieldiana]|uniref:Zn(2)-C6 fungal-type domain-containing protein n=1 Tax=Cercophora newfieldiana TaxID=92897 RepID=A0AA40CZ17_9PEZI|nr:hypothetical protein B0T16DRAFT_316060 [Cercophora newfieldiana]
MSDPPATPATHASQASPSAPQSVSSLRKERGAIAAQACDTCRSRKQRCDEQRPKCGTCQKFKLECNYREPQPTKKDKTLVEILDRIKSLEEKIDSLGSGGAFSSPAALHAQLLASTLAPAPISTGASLNPGPPLHAGNFHLHDASSGSASSGSDEHYKYVSSVHHMLAWPAIQQLLASAQPKIRSFDISSVERERPTGILRLHSPPSHSLPTSTTFASIRPAPGIGIRGQGVAAVPPTVSGLTWDIMQRLSKAYFNTFHLLSPILDRQAFLSSTMPSAFNEGFSQDTASTIAFLVFALGDIALAGTDGLPVHANNGRPSGIKGGSREHPPGLDFFNEARKRMGFNLTECSLENVQIFALASLYYGTCFYPMDLWRMSMSASLACQALITSNPGELSSPRADLIRRIFWHCSIMETCLNLEFGFALTGLEKLESVVGLPDFSGPFSDEDYIGNQESHFQEHFASQIVLRRLLVEFHSVLNQDVATPPLAQMPPLFSHSPTAGTALNRLTIQQLSLQLDQWRGMLPAPLRWHEEAPGAFPNASPSIYSPSVFSTTGSTPLSPTIPTPHHSARGSVSGPPLMFTTDLDAVPIRYRYSIDVQVALLRSRYYYTKYLLHRPFIYKALHYPDAMTHDDALGAAECFKACLKWPVAMSPTCTHKRLIPCIFFFTQNLFGILVLLRLSTTVPILQRIRSTLCGERFEMDAGETVGLYLDWLRDLKEVDSTAGWQWEAARAIYGLED